MKTVYELTILVAFIFQMVFLSGSSEQPAAALFPVSFKGKMGYADATGYVAIVPKWVRAEPFSGDVAKVSLAAEEEAAYADGLIDRMGNYILPPSYQVWEEAASYIITQSEHGTYQSGYYDKASGTLVYPEYEDVIDNQRVNESALIAVKEDGKWGYVSREGNQVVIPFLYDIIRDFQDGYALVDHAPTSLSGVQPDGNHYQLIDKSGQAVPLPDDVKPVGVPNEDGTLIITKHGSTKEQEKQAIWGTVLYGLADTWGRIVLPPQYGYIADFSDGLAAFCTSSHLWGVLDAQGTVVVEPKYSLQTFGEISPFYFFQGHAVLYTDDGRCVILDKNGHETYSCPSSERRLIGHVMDGGLLWFAVTEQEVKYGLMNMHGEVLAPPVFDNFSKFSADGLCKVEMDRKYGYMNKSGQIVIEVRFDAGSDFSEGMTVVYLDEQVFLLNKDGQLKRVQF